MVPLNVTALMYRTNMNCVVLKELVEDLLARGLLTVKVDRKRSFFKTSAAGYEVLKQWRQLEAVVGA